MDKEIIKKIYNDIFFIYNIVILICFYVVELVIKSYVSKPRSIKKGLEKDKKLSIFYPEDMFMELLSRKSMTYLH